MTQANQLPLDHMNTDTDAQLGRREYGLVLMSRMTFAITLSLYILGLMFDISLASAVGAQLSIISIIGVGSFVVVTFGIVALLIINKHPRDTVGWFMLFMMLLFALGSVGGIIAVDIVEQGLAIPDNYKPVADFLYWFATTNWLTYVLAPILFFSLYFPTGRLLSKRWRWVALAGIAVILVNFLGTTLEDSTFWSNPYLVPGGDPIATFIFTFIVPPLILITLPGSLIAIVLRYRQADAVERIQLKWLFYPLALIVISNILYAASLVFFPDAPNTHNDLRQLWWNLASIVMSISLPVAIAIAILRHQLFDINIIIRKTLIYGVLTGLVVLVYVLVVGSAATALQSQNSLGLSVIALGLAGAAFIPARRRLTTFVEHYLPYTPQPKAETEVDESISDKQSADYWNQRLIVLSRVVFIIASTLLTIGLSTSASISIANGEFELLDDVISRVGIVASNGIVALFILRQHPRHVVAWLLLGTGFMFALLDFSSGVGQWMYLAVGPNTISNITLLVFLSLIVLGGMIPIIFIPLYFPTGKLLSKRWRVIVFMGIMATIFHSIGVVFDPVPFEGLPYPSPVTTDETVAETLVTIGNLLGRLVFFTGVISLILRYRQANETERIQMKWVIYTIVLIFGGNIAISMVYGLAPSEMKPTADAIRPISLVVSLNILPVVIGIAILRYRLFDIDIIIRKTLIYGVLTGLVVLVYVLVVGGTTTALQTQNNLGLSLLALGIAGVAFIPAQRQLTTLVERFMPYTSPLVEEKHSTDKSPIGVRTEEADKQGRLLVMSSRIIFALSLVFIVISWSITIILASNAITSAPINVNDGAFYVAISLVTSIVALLIINKHPRHSIGWFMLIVGFTFAIGHLTYLGDIHNQAPFPAPYAVIGDLLYWVGRWLWLPVSFAPGFFFALYFPTGCLLSKQWRIVALLTATFVVISTAGIVFHPGPHPSLAETDVNPYPIAGGRQISQFLEALSFPLFIFVVLAAMVSMILRYRRANAVQRTQLMWLFVPLGVLITYFIIVGLVVLVIPDGLPEPVNTLGILLVLFITLIIPISIGIAILRHRLFDIDILIRKTLIYGTLIAGLGVLYVVSITLLQVITQVFTGPQSDIVLVVTTLAIAVLFTPMRQRIQVYIDRIFYRAKVDFKVAFTNFAREVRSLIDLDELLNVLVARTTDLLKIAHGAVFLLDDGGFHLAQQRNLPEEAMTLTVSASVFSKLANGNTLSEPENTVFPLLVPLMAPQPTDNGLNTFGEQVIGVLALGPRLSDQVYTREDETLLIGLADQAGIAIYVAQLIQQQREEVARREAYLNSSLGRAEHKSQELLQTPENVLLEVYDLAQQAGYEPKIGDLLAHLPRSLQSMGEPELAGLAEGYYYLLSSQQSPELLVVGIRQLENIEFENLIGCDEARKVYGLCHAALNADSIIAIARLRSKLEQEKDSAYFSGLLRGLKGLIPAAAALHAFERVDSTQDSLAYLASAVERLNHLDRTVRNDMGSADRPILHRIIENWLGVVTGNMSELQTRAEIACRLLTRHTSQGDIVSLVMNIRNEGRGAALNIRVAPEQTADYTLLDTIATIPQLGSGDEAQVELRVRPTLNHGISQFRVRFAINYDDPRGPDRVEHFADIVHLLAEEGEFQFIPNPYIVGTPLQSGSPLFYGRDDLFSFVEENLVAVHHNNLVLIGQRRTGKSSFLKQLKARLVDSYIPIYLDGQSVALDPGLASFFYTLAIEIYFELDDRGFDLRMPESEDFASNPAVKFEHEFLCAVRESVADRHLLILLDEFEELEAAVRRGTLDASVFGFLRHLIQHSKGLSMIFCGTHRMEELTADYWSVLFNISLYKHVGFLEQSDMLRLVHDPVEAYNMRYDDLAIDKLWRVTAGHPYFLQLLCHNLVNRHNRTERSYITVADVNGALDDILSVGEAHFVYLWTESSDDERIVLTALSRMIPLTAYTSAVHLVDYLAERGISMDRKRASEALHRLALRDILSSSSGDERRINYGWKLGLLGLWVESYKSLSRVLEELE